MFPISKNIAYFLAIAIIFLSSVCFIMNVIKINDCRMSDHDNDETSEKHLKMNYISLLFNRISAIIGIVLFALCYKAPTYTNSIINTPSYINYNTETNEEAGVVPQESDYENIPRHRGGPYVK